MADKDNNVKASKKVADGFYKTHTVEIEIDGKKVRVFEQEAKMIQEKLAAKAKANKK